MNKKWKSNLLGIEIGEKGYERCKIEESSIIGNQNKIYCIFGIVNRFSKEARIFTVLIYSL